MNLGTEQNQRSVGYDNFQPISRGLRLDLIIYRTTRNRSVSGKGQPEEVSISQRNANRDSSRTVHDILPIPMDYKRTSLAARVYFHPFFGCAHHLSRNQQ